MIALQAKGKLATLATQAAIAQYKQLHKSSSPETETLGKLDHCQCKPTIHWKVKTGEFYSALDIKLLMFLSPSYNVAVYTNL